jgi:hypothetical protein
VANGAIRAFFPSEERKSATNVKPKKMLWAIESDEALDSRQQDIGIPPKQRASPVVQAKRGLSLLKKALKNEIFLDSRNFSSLILKNILNPVRFP